jgi:hypothetical protein
MAARSPSKSALSTGKKPANTTGWAGLKFGSGVLQGRFSSVIVSPTRVSATSLMAAVKKPISPGSSDSTCSRLGRKMPTCSTW